MPFQVSGQLVTTKSSRLLHVAGCDGAFVLAAGVAFVVMMSSADASVAQAAHDASRSRRPGIVVRQAVRAIAPPTLHCPNTTHSSYRATPVGRCWMPQHPTSPVAMQAVLSSQSEPLTRSVG